MRSTDIRNTIINAATDPGVILNIGNAVANAARSTEAMAVNLATATLCLVIRTASELQKCGVVLPLPRFLRKLVENPGAALMANGGMTLLSAAFAAANIRADKPETTLPAIIMGLFASGNIAQGATCGKKGYGTAQRLSDAFAQSAYATALVLASADAPMPVKLCFMFAGASGVAMAALGRQSLFGVSPMLIQAAGAYGSAASNANPYFAAANALWATGYVTLDALKRRGGVGEMFSAIFHRNKNRAQPAMEQPEPQTP